MESMPTTSLCQDDKSLLSAAKSGHETTARLWLGSSVDPNIKDDNGQTPLSLVAENGHKAIIKLHTKTGKIHYGWEDRKSWTPLAYASQNGHKAVVKLLGSAVDKTGNDTNTATRSEYSSKSPGQDDGKIDGQQWEVVTNSEADNGTESPAYQSMSSRFDIHLGWEGMEVYLV
jgi:ankyrin repeat protein